MFTAFKPNGLAYPYQQDESISNFKCVGWYFLFFPNFNRTFCKLTEIPDVVSYLGLHFLLLSHRKDARLIWLVKLMDKK